MLPGLARLGIPIPLGGTSNHFRTRQLRAVDGWDAFNVTEDADLGVRLARQGLRVVPLDSTTFEEATARVKDWLGQRSRWLKGYMHTALVYLRHPQEFAYAVGFWRFFGFVLFVGGAVATALLAPLAWMLFGIFLLSGSEWLLGPYGGIVSATSFITGNAILVALGLIAPLKRRWWKLLPVGLLVPLYWLLISVASYRAADELVRKPHWWNKTRHHGFADDVRPKRRPGPRMSLVRAGGAVAAGLALLLFLALGAHANPWLKEKGDGEFISSTMVTRQQAGLAAGASANAFSDLHLEYGAHEKAPLVVDTGLQQYALGGQAQTVFDTAWAGARVPLRRWDNSLFSAEAVGGISGIRDSPLPGGPLSLDGTGEARLMFGEGFEILDRHAFAGVEAGWRWRGGPPADELVLDTVAGIAPWRSALLMLQSFAISGTGDARGAYRRYDLLKLQLTLAQQVTEHWWLQAGAISTVAGADSGEAGGIIALWWRF